MDTKGIILKIKASTHSSHNEIVGWENGELKIRIHAIPEKGKANKELIAFLAKSLKIPKSHIVLVRGANSKHKELCFLHIEKKELEKRLEYLSKQKENE